MFCCRAWTVDKRTGALALSHSEPKAHSDRITASRWLGNYLYTGAPAVIHIMNRCSISVPIYTRALSYFCCGENRSVSCPFIHAPDVPDHTQSIIRPI